MNREERTPQAAIAAAVDDMRVVAAVLSRTERHGIVGLDLNWLAGGSRYLASSCPDNISAAYAAAVDAALARLPGLESRGLVIRRVQLNIPETAA